eukprot:1161303-Pelagomonas_calceolata.AAC.4
MGGKSSPSTRGAAFVVVLILVQVASAPGGAASMVVEFFLVDARGLCKHKRCILFITMDGAGGSANTRGAFFRNASSSCARGSMHISVLQFLEHQRHTAHSRVYIRAPAHSCAYIRAPAHSHVYIRAPAHSCVYIRAPAHSRVYIRAPAHSCAYIRAKAA